MKIHVGNLKSKIETDNPQLLNALIQLYSFKIPGSEYSPRYKSHRWDGKKRFISGGGIFRTGLLSKVIKDLEKIDCTPEITYSYKKQITHGYYDIDNFSFYDYQEKLIKKALECQRGVVKSPTGSGKTLIMAALVKAWAGKKMVLLFNAKQLLTQTYKFLTDTCGIDNVGLCYGEGYIYGDIMLCTVQSIEKILDTHLKETEVLMVDECHEFANGKLTLAAIRAFPKAKIRLGFTATPPRENIARYNLEGALGEVWEIVETSDLVESGKLARPIIQLVDRTYAASGADEDLSYLEVYEQYIIENDIRKQNERARILILTKSLDHGRTLEDLCGSNCEFLEGADSVGERYNAISRFRGCGESSILIGTKILQTGINIEEITHFINARGMKSEIATLQALGRALRRHDSKEVVYIYDFLDKEKYLLEHSRARKRHYQNEGHEVIIL
jgi:superfamily II DNA or RNA helicase